MTIFFIFGAAYLGVGISNVIHASAIASNGVRVRAVVLGVPKDGPSNATQVAYTTASGQQEQGILEGVSYLPVGSTITVAYDPADPSVVAVPQQSAGGAWEQVAAGGAELLLVPAVALMLVRARKQQPRVPAVPAASDAPPWQGLF